MMWLVTIILLPVQYLLDYSSPLGPVRVAILISNQNQIFPHCLISLDPAS